MNYRVLQRILKWESNEVAGFEIKLTSLEHLVPATVKIEDMLPLQYGAYPITDIYPEMFDWLDLQDQNVWAILTLMVIIAIINMTSVILILILERTQTIGMLKALGLPNYRVKRVFLYNAFLLITAGVLIGNILAFGLIWSQELFGWVTVDQENYFVSVVPVAWPWAAFFMVNVGVVTLCLISMTLPAMAVTRISPVRAIRFE